MTASGAGICLEVQTVVKRETTGTVLPGIAVAAGDLSAA
jgi:hypothetical protein